jgi:predicted transcriptional regulator
MWSLNAKLSHTPPDLKPLGRLERELMHRIWRHGERSVGDLHREFSVPRAYTTILTTLDRLYKKKLLSRRMVGKAFVYAARISEDEYRGLVAQHFINQALDNGSNNNVVLSCFVDALGDRDRQLLARLDKLIKAKQRDLDAAKETA